MGESQGSIQENSSKHIVFVLVGISWDDFDVLGVFTSYEDAEKGKEEFLRKSWYYKRNELKIEEHQIGKLKYVSDRWR